MPHNADEGIRNGHLGNTATFGERDQLDLHRGLNILWIPFCPISIASWDGSRHYHFLKRLSVAHTIQLVDWDRFRYPRPAPRPGDTESRGRVTRHRVTLPPNWWRLWRKGYPRSVDLLLHQYLLNRGIERIIDRSPVDAVVLSVSHYATGTPSLPPSLPVILDHVDEAPGWVERIYCLRAHGIATASPSLYRNASQYGRPSILVENGVELDSYRTVVRNLAKEKFGLDGRLVVSLIGMTCSKTLYFLDAFERFAAGRPDAVLLLLGETDLREKIAEWKRHHQADVRQLGHIPFQQVHEYFKATDIGLYPGDDNKYYNEAFPLKIVEYSAAGCQVVCSPVEAFRHGWPNVWICPASADGFHDGLLGASRSPRPIRDVSTLGWDHQAKRFGEFVRETVERVHATPTGRS